MPTLKAGFSLLMWRASVKEDSKSQLTEMLNKLTTWWKGLHSCRTFIEKALKKTCNLQMSRWKSSRCALIDLYIYVYWSLRWTHLGRTSLIIICPSENYIPIAKLGHHLCSAAVVWTSAALAQLTALIWNNNMNFAKRARRSGTKICSINYCFLSNTLSRAGASFSALLRRPFRLRTIVFTA